MNDRFRNEGSRRESQWRERDRSGESGWREGNRQGARAEPRSQQYSSDEDETYGSEWDRDRGQYSAFDREPAHSSEPRHYGGGNVGRYGSGGRGGYSGGYEGGDYGGSSGTSYDRGRSDRGRDQGLYGGGQGFQGGQHGGNQGFQGQFGGNQGFQGQYGGSQGFQSGQYGGNQGLLGSRDFGRQRGFSSGLDQGYRGRDFGGPGADLRSSSRGALGERSGGFAGRGPKGYSRTDERIREDVCERLSQDDDVDASEIEVSVKDGEVTLKGSVITRSMKHDAEDLAENVSGVRDVHNELRVVKGVLSELKDKITGDQPEQHYAGGGTKNGPSTGAGLRS